MSGFPVGLPPSSEFCSFPRSSEARAVSRLTRDPEAGTIAPTAPWVA
jgi:hypothetical protein